jgi:DNA topoisomerase-3
MIARRFVATFFPAAEFDVTTRISTVAPGHDFKTEGKVLTSPGWLAVYNKTVVDDDSPDSKALPALSPEDKAKAVTTSATLHSETTKPPARYTEATLLSAMEGAGKLVDDEAMADAMKERGLGTPATRADTIEGLINQKYVERNQRELLPTTKAESLLEFLHAVNADALTKPDMTDEWESKLRQMEQNKYPRDKFMHEIVEVTKGIVDRTKTFEETEANSRVTDIISPTDHQPMLETLRGYKSRDGVLTVYKVMSGRKLEESEVRELIATGEIGPLDGFVSAKTGNRFPSKIKIVDDEKKPGQKKAELDFGAKVDVNALEPFWTDPKTKAELCEGPTSYILREKIDGEWTESFKVGRLMCQKPLTREMAIDLVGPNKKTGLIQGFTSKKGRPFDAFLLRVGPKIAWEFPPRAPRAAGKNADGSPKAPRKTKAPLDLKNAQKLGESKVHDGELYLTPDAFVVVKPQADGSPRMVFELKRILCGKELPVDEIERLVEMGKTGLIEGLLSKRGTTFSAYLTLSKDKKKAEFEFPSR